MTDVPIPRPKVLNLRDSPLEPIPGDGACGTFGQPLLTAHESAGSFDVRVVCVKPGGVTSDHRHAWEQANYVLSGGGTIALGDDVREIGRDDFVYVPPMLRHVFSNTGSDDLVLLSTLGPKS